VPTTVGVHPKLIVCEAPAPSATLAGLPVMGAAALSDNVTVNVSDAPSCVR
jgi:hypothetical protein